MNQLVESIREFDPQTYGLAWHHFLALLILVLTIDFFIRKHGSNNFRVAQKTIWILQLVLKAVGYGICMLLAAHSILINEYSHLIAVVLLLIAGNIDHWFRMYDDFVDRKMDKYDL